MKKYFLALEKHIRFKEDTLYNQKASDGFIMHNGYESKISNIMRRGYPGQYSILQNAGKTGYNQ